MSDSVPTICLNVTLRVKSEQREKFLEEIKKNQQGAHQEPLCLDYVVGVDTEDANVFHLQERYKGKEGVDFHVASPHYKEFTKFVDAGGLTSPPEIRTFSLIEN